MELARWRDARHKFPPYQFKDCHCVQNLEGKLYDLPASLKGRSSRVFQSTTPSSATTRLSKVLLHEDCRLPLVGNSWHVGVVPLGLVTPLSLQDIVNRLTPGKNPVLQGLPLRPLLLNDTKPSLPVRGWWPRSMGWHRSKGKTFCCKIPVTYHRLRSSLPAKLWRWRTVAGWKWSGNVEHINVLEARAVLSTVKWRVTQRKQNNLRCFHLVDSLQVLHSLTRGRTSSRKMRSTIMRISAYSSI